MSKVTELHVAHWAVELRHHSLGLATFCWADGDTRRGGMREQGNRKWGGDGGWGKEEEWELKDKGRARSPG